MQDQKRLLFVIGVALCIAEGVSPAVASGPEANLRDRVPRVIKQVDPTYPFSMSRAGVTGRVTVAFTVDGRGQVVNASAVSSTHKAFEEPAVLAISQWKFEPGIKDGKPVAVRLQTSVTFDLKKQPADPRQWSVSKPSDHDSMPPGLRWQTPPEPVNMASPVYPFEALKAGKFGTARIRYVVGSEGSVVDAEIESASAPEFGAAALAAIETWMFKPARKEDGTACMALLGESFDFQPEGSPSVVVAAAARAIVGAEEAGLHEIVRVRDLDAMPERVAMKQPVFPRALLKTTTAGTAMIEFYIGPDGEVHMPRIVSASEPEFGYAAAQAISEWRFLSPTVSGKPVFTQARVPVRFEAQ